MAPSPSPAERTPAIAEQNDARGRTLLRIARESVERAVLGTPENEHQEPWLEEPGATFVTLRCRGALRGCLGSLKASSPLIDDLRRNARAAATRDPRFPPLTARELATIEVEVSLLSPLEEVPCASEEEALSSLSQEKGEWGWYLTFQSHSGTFLPQVWDSLPEPRDFLSKLKEKAGLPLAFWDPGIRLFRYSVSKWRQDG